MYVILVIMVIILFQKTKMFCFRLFKIKTHVPDVIKFKKLINITPMWSLLVISKQTDTLAEPDVGSPNYRKFNMKSFI